MKFFCSANLSFEEAFLNRGMFFAESPFSTILCREKSFIFLTDHMARLKKSYEFLYRKEDWANQERKVLNALKGMIDDHERSFRVTFFKLLEKNEIHFFIYSKIVHRDKKPISIKLVTKESFSSNLPSFFKNGDYCFTNYELDKANDEGYDDILFISQNGEIGECSKSNIFFRKGETVYTPRLKEGILEGITRFRLLDCFSLHNIAWKEGDYLVHELMQADQVWATSSIRGLKSISAIDGHPFPVDESWNQQMDKLFKNYIEKYDQQTT